jgi:hypothetical protein
MAAAIQAYFDGSGQTARRKRDGSRVSRFVTLAGYIAIPDAWRVFNQRWAALLDRLSCDYLHMANFNARNGWPPDRVAELVRDAFNTCLAPLGWEAYHRQFFGAACTVDLEDYDRACRDHPLVGRKRPEAICLDNVVGTALKALPEDHRSVLGKSGTVELFFDQGESFMPLIDRAWRSELRQAPNDPLRLVSKIREANMRTAAPLQAADFLAWHTHQIYAAERGERAEAAAWLTALAAPTYRYYLDYEALVRDYGEDSQN